MILETGPVLPTREMPMMDIDNLSNRPPYITPKMFSDDLDDEDDDLVDDDEDLDDDMDEEDDLQASRH